MSTFGAIEGLSFQTFVPRVLIIEEDIATHQFWSVLIRKITPNCSVEFASNAEDAERLIASSQESDSRYNLVISNMFLKGEMSGLELWRLYSESDIFFPQFIIVSSVPITEYESLLSDELRKPYFVRKPLDPTFCGNLISKTFFEINQRTHMQKNLKGKI